MSLSSLIVEREIASIREIEEALARQVLYGGDFVTNLLEVSRIEESALMPVVAESYGLVAVPPGELPRVSEDAVRLVAAEVVAERSFVPLEVGESLVVAVAEPLSRDAEQELTFALALPIEQRIAPLFRIRQALARDYGIALDKRIARLLTKVVHKGPRIASTFPPPRESSPVHRVPPRPPSIAPPPREAPVESPRAIATGPHQGQSTFVREAEASPARPARRRRGPLTLEVANTELEASAERDVIFDILFEFARQFFDYTALFIVHGDIAEGRDAFGDGAARDKVARVGVPLDLPNVLASARDGKALLRRTPARDGLDPVLMADLGREGTTECIVFPIIVRTRVVALLFGDGGATGIDDGSVRQVETLVESASGAFERVIMRRKLKTETQPTGGGVAQAQRNAADSLPPPPPATQVSTPPITLDISERPAVEELAAPIRDLMAEPVSRVAVTTREPTPLGLGIAADPMAVRSDRPPPANLLAVRKPSGRPIPREEPEGGAPAATSLVGTMKSEALGLQRGRSSPAPRPSGPPAGSKSGSMKRAEAPVLEFGVPSMPSVVTEATFGSDTVERQLIAQIQGTTEPPRTTRDPDDRFFPRGYSSRPPAPAWAGDPTDLSDAGRAEIADATGAGRHEPKSASFSPKAESPPPMPSAPITDVSPTAIGPIAGFDHSPAAPDVKAQPVTPQVRISSDMPDAPDAGVPPVPSLPQARLPSAPVPLAPRGSTLLAGSLPMLPAQPRPSYDDDDDDDGVAIVSVTPISPPVTPLIVLTPEDEMEPVDLSTLDARMRAASSRAADDASTRETFDPDATPLAPAVELRDADATPLAGSVELVLALAKRKGSPPVVLPPQASKPMPPSEQQVSVPAHKPPSSHNEDSRVLPSVIVDVASEYVTLVDRVLAGPDDDAETDLRRAGGYAMPAIMAKFPGPISVDPERLIDGPLPHVAECGPIIRLIASQRRTALPFVLAHVEAPNGEARFWATYLLTELVYPDAIDAAVARTFDEDPLVRRAARAAARALAEAHPQPVVERLGEIARTQSARRRVQAIEALGETREALAVAELLPMIAETTEEIVAASRTALVLLTRQDFGLDPDRWGQWWDANKSRHRLEWLIDALMHEQRAIRGAASEDLRTITKEFFGYHDDLPKRERERAQARYLEWWENIGRVRFSRASTRGG